MKRKIIDLILVTICVLASAGAKGQVMSPQQMSPATQSGTGADWTGLENVYGSDDMYAEAVSIPGGGKSKDMFISTLFTLPDDARLEGIEVLVERRILNFTGTGGVIDSVFYCLERKSSDSLTGSDEIASFGGPADTWTVPTIHQTYTCNLRYAAYYLDPDSVNYADVGVDDIQILVYYTIVANEEHIIAPYSGMTDYIDFPVNCQGTAKIYNSYGMQVKQLSVPSRWDGTDQSGMLVPAGEYYIICNGNQEIRVSVIK